MRQALLQGIVGLLWAVGSLGVCAQPSFWEQTNGPGGGIAFDLAATPQGDVYTLVDKGFQGTGLFHSDDDGVTWRALPTPTTRLTMMAASPSGRLFATRKDSVYYSDDRGLRWTLSRLDEANEANVVTLAFTPTERIVAGTTRGVYRSDDDGATWQAAGLDSVAVLGVLHTSAGALIAVSGGSAFYDGPVFVTVPGHVYRSDDDGATWQHLASFEPDAGYFYSVTLAEHPNGAIYLGATGQVERYYEKKGPGVFRLDATGTLTRVGLHGISITNLELDGPLLRASVAGINSLYGPTKPGGFFTAFHDTTWTQSGLRDTRIIDFVRTPQGTLIAGTAYFFNDIGREMGWGLLRSTDGGTAWDATGQGIPHAETYALAVGAGLLCAAADISVFCTDDRGETWERVYTPEPADVRYGPPFYPGLAVHPSGDLFVWSGTGLLLRSADRGATWIEMPVEAPKGSSFRLGFGVHVSHRHRLIVSATGTVLVSDRRAGIWRTPDRGETWGQVEPEPGLPVIGLAAAPTGRLFALTQEPGQTWREYHDVSFYTSDDDGISWTLQATLPPLAAPSYLATNTDDLVYILADEWLGDYSTPRFFHVKEESEAWTVAIVADAPQAHDLVLDADGRLFAGGDYFYPHIPVFISQDEGRTWQPLADDVLPQGRYVDGLAVAVDADGYLYAGTTHNGVFRNKTIIGTATESEVEVPDGLALEAGYPNPFTRTVTIPFVLARPARVTLAIYDLLGRRAATVLAEEPMQAGRHEIRWEAAGRPAGVYVYKLIADDAVKAGRLVLVK